MAAAGDDITVRPNRVPWPPILLAGAIVGAVALGQLLPVNWPGVDDGPAHAIGLAFGLGGLLLTIWAAVTLHRANTAVLPHHGASKLVTNGPFAWRRNPIYLGDILILFGIAELTKNIWFVGLAVLFGVLVTWLAILPEERHLEAKFGDAWREYAERTRRLL